MRSWSRKDIPWGISSFGIQPIQTESKRVSVAGHTALLNQNNSLQTFCCRSNPKLKHLKVSWLHQVPDQIPTSKSFLRYCTPIHSCLQTELVIMQSGFLQAMNTQCSSYPGSRDRFHLHVSSSEIQWFVFLCLRKQQWEVGREEHFKALQKLTA